MSLTKETIKSKTLLTATEAGEVPGPEEIKEILLSFETRLKKLHQEEVSGGDVVREYTLFIDQLLKELFEKLTKKYLINETVSLIALGGYGRSELNLRSDVDLMLVYKKKITPAVKELTEKLLYILWDSGLDVGFSIRSVKESIALARDDLKTLTALLDTRLITGDTTLHNELERAVYTKLLSGGRSASFIEEKRAENRTRHTRFGGTVYILEPNVKEALGGLRDIHTARWIVQAKTLKKDVDLIRDGFLSEDEATEFCKSFDFLLWIRNELHFLTLRKTEQLSFSHQVHISRILGLKDTERALAVEEFMQIYYGHASNISRLSELIISRALGAPKKGLFKGVKKKEIDRDFTLVDDMVSVNSDAIFSEDPSKMIRAFEYSQTFSADIDTNTCDQILKNLYRFDDTHRSSKSVASTFIKILKGKNTYKALEAMHNLRFLETYIPEFKDIKFKVQHDLYHVYTVDVHTLFAVRELDRLSGVLKKDFFLYSTLYEELEKPELLILGVLLHDIGKALGKGHAVTGAEMVPKILGRMGFEEEDIELVRFLVRYHLILADTAQYRDFQDEKLMVEFARDVGSISKLNMLFLLTFADVRAVGPEVWNKWKGTLFQDFYFKALKVIERGSFEVGDLDETIAKIKKEVTVYLKDAHEESLEGYLRLLPPRYFFANSPEMIASHMSIVDALKDEPQVMRTAQNVEGAYTEIIICAHDVFGLFSMISGVMAANSVNILDAHIYTLQNGIVLDILQVKSPIGERITDKTKLEKI
ncbi:MAG: [protein-PII] uridylyltransferase, partial [Thermodesulfobacteriota bacterium]